MALANSVWLKLASLPCHTRCSGAQEEHLALNWATARSARRVSVRMLLNSLSVPHLQNGPLYSQSDTPCLPSDKINKTGHASVMPSLVLIAAPSASVFLPVKWGH